MLEIFLIRHGETDWNAERRLQGHMDIPLNQTGKRQALAVARALQSEPVTAIFASDLVRAQQTAEPIAAHHGVSIQSDPGLRERCFGAFEGLQRSEISSQYPLAYAQWLRRDADARYPPGQSCAETLRECFQRVMKSLQRIVLNSDQNSKIVVVTHGGVLDSVYRAATGISLSAPREFDILNASINHLAWQSTTFRIKRWGDVAHLSQQALDETER